MSRSGQWSGCSGLEMIEVFVEGQGIIQNKNHQRNMKNEEETHRYKFI
jgi:hypothetical protein